MPRARDRKRDDLGYSLLQELTMQWSALPYLGLGILLAWVALTFSGTLWLSDVEINGTNLSYLYIAPAVCP